MTDFIGVPRAVERPVSTPKRAARKARQRTFKTERNKQIYKLRSDGLFPFEIARQLGVSRNTIIGVLNRAGLCDPNVNRSIVAKLAGNGGGRKRAPEHFRKLVLETAARCGAEAAARQWGLSGTTVRNWRRLAA